MSVFSGWMDHREGKAPSPHLKNQVAVKDKLKQVRYACNKSLGHKLSSSISLPLFSLARLKHAVRQIEAERAAADMRLIYTKPYSEQEVLAACLIMLLTRLRRVSRRQMQFARNRLYNDKKYSYGKVSTCLEAELWQTLQQRALDLRTSLSYLADLALRLYLRRVIARVRQPRVWRWKYDPEGFAREVGQDWGLLNRGAGTSWLRQLLRRCSYQRSFSLEKHGSPERGRSAEFQVTYHLKFG